mgnify:CR=1 FL=1
MRICKQTLKEIGIYGTDISDEAKTHLTVCQSCAEVYRIEKEMENFLLSAGDFKAPENLKQAVLQAVNNQQQKKPPLPVFQFALKTAAVLILLISGFWLGLQTANNGNGVNERKTSDFNIINASPYRLNMEPLYPENLSEIYFTVLEDVKNGK